MIIMGLVMAKLYKRSTKRMSFVRTGARGQKVVKDGGALIIPIMHETIDINMETLITLGKLLFKLGILLILAGAFWVIIVSVGNLL